METNRTGTVSAVDTVRRCHHADATWSPAREPSSAPSVSAVVPAGGRTAEYPVASTVATRSAADSAAGYVTLAFSVA
jgi:hypothetical protein